MWSSLISSVVWLLAAAEAGVQVSVDDSWQTIFASGARVAVVSEFDGLLGGLLNECTDGQSIRAIRPVPYCTKSVRAWGKAWKGGYTLICVEFGLQQLSFPLRYQRMVCQPMPQGSRAHGFEPSDCRLRTVVIPTSGSLSVGVYGPDPSSDFAEIFSYGFLKPFELPSCSVP